MLTSLSKRAKSVLYALVTEFISSAEPVGSRTLAKKYGLLLSPATIRNVLADLEDSGYLEQPHTSAGRVPTERAFRFFVDALMEIRKLPEVEAIRIQEWFECLAPDMDILRETGKFLSDMSKAPAVLVRSRSESRHLLTLRFIPTRALELLAVIVFSDGTVESRYVHLDKATTDSELDRLHNLLEEVVRGRTLIDLRDYLAEGLTRLEGEYTGLRQLGHSLVRAAIDSAARDIDVVIQGQSRLLDRPEFSERERIRAFLDALEDRERLLGLLDRTLAAQNVHVFLGRETLDVVGCSVSVVAAPYREPDGPSGALGVIGPTRMDYPSVVPIVQAMASAMSATMARLRREAKDRSV